jgi:hypothetical protein
MAAIINSCAWDGAWYARSFDDDGLPIGVSGAPHHAIDLIAQSWSVIGEVAPPERAEKAMNSADEKLDTPFGLALIWPPYDGFDPRVCGISTFVPGAKENGGIFCHSNPWSMVAAAMLGHGDDAYRYYRQILPLARTDSDVYKVEPYVYPQNICGPAHPSFGMARNAWLTGGGGLDLRRCDAVDPRHPAHFRWAARGAGAAGGLAGFTAHREFRGTAYEISVRREGPGNAVTTGRRRACRSIRATSSRCRLARDALTSAAAEAAGRPMPRLSARVAVKAERVEGGGYSLSGDPQAMARDIRAFEGLGVDHLALVFDATEPAQLVAAIERFDSEVVRAVGG